MTESECLAAMVPPGAKRLGKYMQGVIQIHLTRACDKACFGCTQGSQLGGKSHFITPENFEAACRSLVDYFGVVGVFGGNPALHPRFEDLCAILREHIPFERRGLWCNNPVNESKALAMRRTFNPAVSNLNVHQDAEAWERFRRWWPESAPFGLKQDSRHAPVHVAMKDIEPDEGERWRLISQCDINRHWSAMVGQFRGELRAWFCEVAGGMAMLYQDDPAYPDTGKPLWSYARPMGDLDEIAWWQEPMTYFRDQVRKHCHECGVPFRGFGEMANADRERADIGTEQASATHAAAFKPKRLSRRVELVVRREQLAEGRTAKMTDYLGNAKR